MLQYMKEKLHGFTMNEDICRHPAQRMNHVGLNSKLCESQGKRSM